MSMLTGRHFLQGLLYLQFAEFADMGPFMAEIDPLMAGEPYSFESVEKLEKLVTTKSFLISDDPNRSAINYYISKIVVRSCSLYRSDPRVKRIVDFHADVEASLIHYNQKAYEYFIFLGIELEIPNIYFVDKFPDPFGDKNFLAMSMDASDERIYGIRPGLYFKRSALRPSYSVVILLHEWVHVVMSRFGEKFFGGPLEEGLAEAYGCIFLSSRFVDPEFAKTVYVYHRLFSANNKFLDVYLDYARYAFCLFERVGIDGIHDLFRKNRSNLKLVESELWKQGPASDAVRSLNDQELEFRNTLQFLLMMAGKTSHCSALAKRVAEFTSANETVQSISKRSGIPQAAVSDALKELSGAPRLVEMNGEIVAYSDCERLVSPLQLRFTVST